MQHPACVFGRKGRSFSWEGPRLFGKTCLWGGLPQRRGLRVLLLAASLLEKTGAPCGVQRKLYGRLLFSFSTDSGAFPSFSKGEPGEYPKAPAPSGLTAAGQNGTITLLNGKVRFPLPPLSRRIDRAGRHSFGIAAAGAACILIERKQGPEQNGTKPGRECPAAWE